MIRWGAAALIVCGLQLFSGVLLALYYHPTPEAAHGSIAHIMSDVPFGWLMRSLHARGADLFVALVFAHLVTTFFRATYRPPRSLMWLTGCALFGIVLAFCFSGSLLPWDTLAYSATQVGTEEVGTVPFLGPALLRAVRGGDAVSGATLARFYVGHITLLPCALLAGLAAHLYLIRQNGLSEPLGDARPKVVALAGLAAGTALLGLLVLAAVLHPRELGAPADPLAAAPAGIRPEWYFTPPFETLRLLPGKILFLEAPLPGNIFFGTLSLLWLTVPFWDRSGRSWFAKLLGVFTVVWAVGVTVYSYTRAP